MKGINIIRLSISYKVLYYQEKSPVFQVPTLQELINHELQVNIQPCCNSVVSIHLYHALACIFVLGFYIWYYHRTCVHVLHQTITASTISTLYTSSAPTILVSTWCHIINLHGGYFCLEKTTEKRGVFEKPEIEAVIKSISEPRE